MIYFKRASEQINHGQPTCPECGNINPEQIFTIIETRVLDEFGNPTTKRKISPQQWHAVFLGRKIADVAAESDFEAAASPSGLKSASRSSAAANSGNGASPSPFTFHSP